ncbi:Endoglucanase [Microbacterium lemovicicum]|uniref:Endoglucanase n=1 Tax=Microbacterium lemovicicum TaxID=1072463 RepID=A0A3Q9IWH4_9MICO|nr:cellulase family glycosylhydrolase [Microbacterium lemovicicum]AZS35903.1 Endoglucanase [Microbacterium lemovicicum]
MLSILSCLTGCVPEKTPLERYLAGKDYLRGVNLYTLVLQRDAAPGATVGDSQASYDYLADRGVSVVRLGVPWQQLQPIAAGQSATDALSKPVSADYLDLLESQVDMADKAGIRIILDLHNGCTYPWGPGAYVPGSVVCGDGISPTDVKKVWLALSDRFREDDRVAAYNLFNEPRARIGVDLYFDYVQVVIDALRSSGDHHAIWIDSMPGGAPGGFPRIAEDGSPLHDPIDALVYSQHFYRQNGESRARLLERVTDFGLWCQRNGVHCSIGEMGWKASAPRGTADVFTAVYELANSFEMDVLYFNASSVPKSGDMAAYFAATGSSSIDSSGPQANVIEQFLD